jgi:hypothetical protein
MLTGDPERVLATMGVLGGAAAVLGGGLVALNGPNLPRELPDRT